MGQNGLPAALQARLPFFYGWIVLACVCCAGFARQGPAVATLSIFVSPMSDEFGWSRTAISSAVSLGGILAAVSSPALGPMLDRHGSRVTLSLAVLTTGLAMMALSLTPALAVFIALFCIGRMNFAGPFDLGIYGAVNSWFVRKRGLATSIANLAQMVGLIAMPLLAQAAILYDGWRTGWLVIGATVLIVGFLPTWFLVVRRPEDMGLAPDGDQAPLDDDGSPRPELTQQEPRFTRHQALRTPAFWLLSLYTLLVFPVQAGISLHQAPHLIESGITPTTAALVVSAFSLASAISGFGFGLIVRRISVRVSLAFSSMSMAVGVLLMTAITSPTLAFISAVFFGLGIGGILTVLPIAWADYFGRRSYGAIRGVALTVQVVAQATGPLLSGVLRDLTGNYALSLWTFAGLVAVSALVAIAASAPKPPTR
ncbi:MAG: MFS transporter [Pseudomonadota bacterium]